MTDQFVDYFKILEIPKEASLQAIKSAYRLVAKRLHPDLNEKDTTKEFQLAQKAYETLSHAKDREQYLIEYSYLKSQEKSKERKEELIKESTFYEIFYYQVGEELSLQDFDQYFLELKSLWFHSDERLPEAQFYNEKNTSNEEMDRIIQRLYLLREKKKDLIYFEFNGHLVLSKLTDLGSSMAEIIGRIKVLLHDNPAYHDQAFYGYALYFVHENLNIWLHDDLSVYYELYLELSDLFPDQSYPEIINYQNRFSKLDEIALIVKLKNESIDPIAVQKLLKHRSLDQIKAIYQEIL
ncbi:J domain-containing protein [bacterium]|nr:J domain-containing protein [bacterium]